MDCARHRRRQQEPRWLVAFRDRWESLPDMEGPADRRGKPPKIPPPPQPTAEERALQQEQVQLLQFQRAALERQQKQQEQLQPLFFEASGIEPVLDEAGNIVSFKRREDPFQAQQEEILGLQLKRSKAALAGELPVDPALIRSLDEEEEDLRNFLRQRFGPDFETATPAIQALAEHSKRKNEVLDAARRGDLTLAEGLSMAREGGLQRQTDLFLTRGAGTASLAGSTAPGFGSAAAGFGEPISFLRNQRLLEFDVGVRNLLARKQFQNQLIATGVGVGLGAIGGAALGPAVGLSAGSGALVGATGNIGTLPFLSMRRGEEDLRFPRRA